MMYRPSPLHFKRRIPTRLVRNVILMILSSLSMLAQKLQESPGEAHSQNLPGLAGEVLASASVATYDIRHPSKPFYPASRPAVGLLGVIRIVGHNVSACSSNPTIYPVFVRKRSYWEGVISAVPPRGMQLKAVQLMATQMMATKLNRNLSRKTRKGSQDHVHSAIRGRKGPCQESGAIAT
jgi:hypothetical protein